MAEHMESEPRLAETSSPSGRVKQQRAPFPVDTQIIDLDANDSSRDKFPSVDPEESAPKQEPSEDHQIGLTQIFGKNTSQHLQQPSGPLSRHRGKTIPDGVKIIDVDTYDLSNFDSITPVDLTIAPVKHESSDSQQVSEISDYGLNNADENAYITSQEIDALLDQNTSLMLPAGDADAAAPAISNVQQQSSIATTTATGAPSSLPVGIPAVMPAEVPSAGADPVTIPSKALSNRGHQLALEKQRELLARSNRNMAKPTSKAEKATPQEGLSPKHDGVLEAEESDGIEDYSGDEEWKVASRHYSKLKKAGKFTLVDTIEYKRAEKQHQVWRATEAVEHILIDEDVEDLDSAPIGDPNVDEHTRAARALAEKATRSRGGDKAVTRRATTKHNLSDNLATMVAEERSGREKKKIRDNKRRSADLNGSDHDQAKKSKRRRTGEKGTKNQTENPLRGTDGEKGKKKRGKKAQQVQENLKDMLQKMFASNDIVQDVAQAQSAEPQANFQDQTATRHRRTDALKMLADVPTEFYKEAKAQQKELDKAVAAFGRRRMKPDWEKGLWELLGMNTRLMNHQVLGAGWMITRERGANEAKGGLLADEVGFGKTVMSIALMVGEQALKTNPTKATLVVVPTSELVDQWFNEIKKHVGKYDRGDVIVYRRGNRLMTLHSDQLLESAFCVITTYNELMKSFQEAQAKCPNELVTSEQISHWYQSEGSKYLGVLHGIQWHRVILDECTAIKNSRSATAKACRLLVTKHRWLLSATPLVNSVKDLYSYMLFLRMKLAGSYEQFKLNFVDSEMSMERVQHVISTIVYRRTNQSRLFGKKIIDLPPSCKLTVSVKLSRTERKLYDIVRMRILDHVHSLSKSGHLRGRYRQIFVLMLRLRQLTCHWLLCWETINNLLEPEDREELLKVIPEADPNNHSAEYAGYGQLRNAVADAIKEAHNAKQNTQTEIAIQDTSQDGDFGKHDLDPKQALAQIDKLASTKPADEFFCCLCESIPHGRAVKTSCGHLYCKECLDQLVDEALANQQTNASCAECGEVWTDVDVLPHTWLPPNVRKVLQIARRENGNQSWTGEEILLPSSKVTAVKAQLARHMAENRQAKKNDKIIVYAEFRAVIDCLARICRDENWGHEVYHGGMTSEQRREALVNFDEKPEVEILIASLRAGSQGLNLTVANNMIVMDLWFNHSVEKQCFGRMLRIGQEKDCNCIRMVAEETIDEDLVKMQDRKSEAISKALNDDSSMSRKLNMTQLLTLFDPAIDSPEGSRDPLNPPFVEPDYTSYSSRDQAEGYQGGERGADMVFTQKEDLGALMGNN